MYKGRRRQGYELAISVLCVNASDAPTAPDAVPSATVYGPDGKVLSGRRLPILEPTAAPAFFQGKLFLGEDYTPGSYGVTYRWLISGTYYAKTDSFEVAPGGSGQGPVVSIVRYDRPHANHLVNKRAAGDLYRGRGPRL